MYGPVPFSIHYAQNSKGFSPRVLELVGSVGGDVHGVVRGDGMEVVSQSYLAGTGEHHDTVLMLVSLERGEAARLDGEAAHFKGGFRFGH